MYKRCVRCDGEFRMLAINIGGRNERAEKAGRASRTGRDVGRVGQVGQVRRVGQVGQGENYELGISCKLAPVGEYLQND